MPAIVSGPSAADSRPASVLKPKNSAARAGGTMRAYIARSNDCVEPNTSASRTTTATAAGRPRPNASSRTATVQIAIDAPVAVRAVVRAASRPNARVAGSATAWNTIVSHSTSANPMPKNCRR
jgi:hypothetical protein